MWEIVAQICLLLGLVLTALGAGIAAKAVIISGSQANQLAAAKWDSNQELKDALLNKSHKARRGLIIIVIGAALQIAGTAIPLIMVEWGQ
jgi:hypothetical protein